MALLLVLLLRQLVVLRHLHRQVDRLVDLVDLRLGDLLLVVHGVLEDLLLHLLDRSVLLLHRLLIGTLWYVLEMALMLLVPTILILELLLSRVLWTLCEWLYEDWSDLRGHLVALLCGLLGLGFLHWSSWMKYDEALLIWFLLLGFLFFDELV